MSDAPGREAPILYQYFWVKIASKEEVDRQRRESLTAEGDAYLTPQTVTVHPPPLRNPTTLAARQVTVDIGVRIDMAEIERHDKYVDVYILDGHSRATAEAWITTEKGRAWKGNAFCFLCHASVEIR